MIGTSSNAVTSITNVHPTILGTSVPNLITLPEHSTLVSVYQVSISQTFYKQIFHTKNILLSFKGNSPV
jgi:hypothetical protein